MKKLGFAIVFAVTLSLAFSFSPQAFAGLASCSDPYPSTADGTGPPQTERLVCNEQGLATWYIPDDAQFGEPGVNDPNPRVPIGYQPGAGPWVKHLEIDPNDIAGQQVVPSIPPYSDTLEEYLVVAGSDPWSDWHEIIMNQQVQEWQFDPASVQITTSSGSAVNIQFPSPYEVWVDFDPPLPVGTFVNINKDLIYIGPDPIIPQPFIQFIEVWQYPTVFEERVLVAGETLSIDSTALILLGAQSTMAWLLPIAVSVTGIGLVIIRKRI